MENLEASPVLLPRILLATDFSIHSARALPYAVDIAKRFGSKLYIAHVVPVDVLMVAGSKQMANALEGEERDAHAELRSLVDSISSAGIECESLIGTGDVGLVLEEFITNYHVDLVASGTVGRTGLSKVLLGSIAEELLRECPCPVLTVGRRVAEVNAIEIRGVLYATDFSLESLAAGQFALSFAEKYQCSLALLHCLEGFPESPYLESHLARARIRSFVGDANVPSEPELIVERGSPANLILKTVEARKLGLVVMGARGVGAFARASSHFGSTAHKVITHAPCPVLTVRQRSNQSDQG